jgi:hypothetical protein
MLTTIFESLKPVQRSLISAFLGLFGYGAWAYLVNSMHGSAAALKAAGVQGSYSFILTFVMTILIEWLYSRVGQTFLSDQANKIFTIFLTCMIVFSASWWINAMAGTPEIFDTVILGYVIGGVYTTSYVIGLAGERVRKQS